MTREEMEILAAEYALGTLEPRKRAKVARALAEDPALSALVEDWERKLAPLGATVAPETPSAALWDSISAAIEREPAGTETIRAEEGEWQRLSRGIERKMLTVDESAKSRSFLLRLAPGAVLPEHPHDQLEECIVLEGTLEIGDLKLTRGDYHIARPGAVHPPIVSPDGAVIYLRTELRDMGGYGA